MGLLYWYLLPLLPFAGAGLWFAYRRRGRGSRRTVSSVLVLKLLARASIARARFDPPLRFYLELLTVVLLGSAAAGIVLHRNPQRLAILVDNSLSTSARPAAGGGSQSFGGATVFESLLETTRREISMLSSETQITLFVTSPQLTRITDEPVTPSRALDMLTGVTWRFSPDTLTHAPSEIEAAGDFDQIVLITDRRIDNSEVSQSVRFISSTSTQGELDNITLSEFSLHDMQSRGAETELSAELQSYAQTSVPVTMVVESLDENGATRREVGRRNVTLDGKANRTVVITDKLARDERFFRARIEIPAPRRVNAILGDDVAFATRNPPRTHIVVVSDLSPAQLGLGSIPRYEFVAPGTGVEQDELMESAQAILFHRREAPSLEEQLPPRPSFYVLPPGKGIFSIPEPLGPMEIVRWDAMHPLMNYLNLPLLALPQAGALHGPRWVNDIVVGNRGPLVQAGQRGAIRYAVAGIEIFPFEGGERPLLSIFLLNMLQWLTATEGISATHPAEAILKLSPDTTAIHYLEGDVLPVEKYQDSLAVRPPRPGILQITGARGSTWMSVGANFPQESDLHHQNITIPSEVLAHTRAASQTPAPPPMLSWWCALFAAVLIAFDVLLVMRRQRA